jgi:uncharacterized membrane protein YkvA (DUF1232 family)
MNRITLISIPVEVPSDTLQQVNAAFRNSLSEITESEEQYVERKIESMIERLKRSQTRWVRDTGAKAQLLWALYNDDKFFSSVAGSKEIRTTITAALFYLCNPFDIIPDHVPVIGFADDALVINHCIRRLKSHPALKPFLKSKRIRLRVK